MEVKWPLPPNEVFDDFVEANPGKVLILFVLEKILSKELFTIALRIAFKTDKFKALKEWRS
jgi:hypothetical protein